MDALLFICFIAESEWHLLRVNCVLLCFRFPVVTWRHSKTKAVLLRASGFHGKGVMGMLKGHGHNQPTGESTGVEILHLPSLIIPTLSTIGESTVLGV